MIESISKYEVGELSLGSLVSNLEALRDVLENPSDEFRAKFDSLWGDLEDTYAGPLYEERASPNQLESEIVTKAIAGLRTLIASQVV